MGAEFRASMLAYPGQDINQNRFPVIAQSFL